MGYRGHLDRFESRLSESRVVTRVEGISLGVGVGRLTEEKGWVGWYLDIGFVQGSEGVGKTGRRRRRKQRQERVSKQRKEIHQHRKEAARLTEGQMK
eukprot:756067-Hanusia_phi.AAC.1